MTARRGREGIWSGSDLARVFGKVFYFMLQVKETIEWF